MLTDVCRRELGVDAERVVLTDAYRRELGACSFCFTRPESLSAGLHTHLHKRNLGSRTSAVRPNFHLRGSISLPTTPKLLSDPYKYDYQRRRTRSAGAERRKSSTAKQSPAAVWSPSAERPQRLVSELENIIRLSETLLTSSASSRSVPSSAESTPPRTRKRKKRSSSSQASHATARCPRDSKRCLHGVKLIALTASRDPLSPLATSSDAFTPSSTYALMVTRRRRALLILVLKTRLLVFRVTKIQSLTRLLDYSCDMLLQITMLFLTTQTSYD
ncbi:hypothetical protein B0H15DRAFT_804429 [Mycena belliarum]|uniref:Uncharacterized protein n=1 Tax=Mycena belliarum TaxID=1033014 RepID=A0AAD6XJT8_9AGAR|nr:hypothetical protein B0H15DRAFT_804429 [Mycena belliae]